MLRRLIIVCALVVLVIALWPNANSLYDLTGEESRVAQARGVLHWINSAIRPQPRLAQETNVAHATVSPFGMNTFLQWEVLPEVRERTLRILHEAGFHYIRQEFTWEDIEIHAKGDFTDRRNDPAGVSAWAKYDNIVALAEQYDIEVVARLSAPPAWSRSQPPDVTGYSAPPDDFDDYSDFVAAVAERYRGRIRYYQLWNEPNIYPEWGEQLVDPEAYTELLCIGYRRLKAADPNAIVLAGALAPTVALNGRDLNDILFFERMYQAGAGECFDIASAQGYGLWSGATDQRLRPTVINYPHHLLLRDVMVRHGDAEKSLWISEMGWNTVPEHLPANYGRVSPEQQGRYAIEAYRRAEQEWPWIGVIAYWFFKRPSDAEQNQSWYYFRLLEPDFTPQLAWEQLADYTASSPAVPPQPVWLYDWMQLRPGLFLVSSAILFFALLRWLAPDR